MVSLAFHTLHFSPMFGERPRPLEEIVRATAAAGFAGLGLDEPVIEEYLDRGGSLTGLAETLADSGLVATDVLPFLALPDAAAEPAITRIADIGLAVGAPTVIASAPAPMGWREMADAFAVGARVCAERGLRLGVEYAPHSSLRTLSEAVRVGDDIGWDGVGLVVDSFHSLLGGASTDEIRALPAERIAVVQYSDGRTMTPIDRRAESRHHRRIPGAGVLDLRAFVDAVRATGYDGVVASEVLSAEFSEGADAADVARRCHAAMVADWVAV